MTQLESNDYYTLLPLIILTVWACVLLLVDLFIPKDRKGITAFLAALGLAVTLGFTISQIGSRTYRLQRHGGARRFLHLHQRASSYQRFVWHCSCIRIYQTDGHRARRILYTSALQRDRHDAHGAGRRPHHRLPRAWNCFPFRFMCSPHSRAPTSNQKKRA